MKPLSREQRRVLDRLLVAKGGIATVAGLGTNHRTIRVLMARHAVWCDTGERIRRTSFVTLTEVGKRL